MLPVLLIGILISNLIVLNQNNNYFVKTFSGVVLSPVNTSLFELECRTIIDFGSEIPHVNKSEYIDDNR